MLASVFEWCFGELHHSNWANFLYFSIKIRTVVGGEISSSFGKVEICLKFWWWVIANEMASHYGLSDFAHFQENLPLKLVPSNLFLFLLQDGAE